MKRPENQAMEDFLSTNGVKARAKYIWKGSMKRTWRIYGEQEWSESLREQFKGMGFADFDGRPLHRFSSNGGRLALFVTGHYEMVEGIIPGTV